MSMHWKIVAAALFPAGHDIIEDAPLQFLRGTGEVNGLKVSVIGTCGHAAIGVELALAQAEAVLETVELHPGRPIVILVDTQGQRLRHRDEMLGLHSYMAHLAMCLDLARRRGHTTLALVYDQALSGGFITSGLMADACYALPEASIRVMGLPAMARITKVPEERLTELAASNPVFAPGAVNYLAMGGIEDIWHDQLADRLAAAIASAGTEDGRARLGHERGGRRLAHDVIEQVIADGHSRAA